jgi:monoamine oxidase
MRHPLSRRHVLGLSLAAAVARPVNAPTQNPDVVIVGAGVAGLAAARVLTAGGRSVTILEASPRIGGRVFTDIATFGVPFDRGATWIHGADENVMTRLAKFYGFDVVTEEPEEILYLNGARATAAEAANYSHAFYALGEAIGEAAHEETDVAASTIVPTNVTPEIAAWLPTAAAAIGPLDIGVDLEDFSVQDWHDREDKEPTAGIRQGFGTLVGRMADGLPISPNARVARIIATTEGVAVESTRGALRAKAVLVTVSTGVLASVAIAFDPVLDGERQKALVGLPMGLVTKVALMFDPNSPALAFAPNTSLVPQVHGERGNSFTVKPLNQPLAVCQVGGSLAWDLSTQPQSVAVDFARDRLRAILGTNADRGFKRGAASDWGSSPYTLGAYAAPRPGSVAARAKLDAPHAERVFFAGEAQAGSRSQSVEGAHESGTRMAAEILRFLKR